MADYNTNPKEKTAELLCRNGKLCVFGRIGGDWNWGYVYDDSEEATAACVLWVEGKWGLHDSLVRMTKTNAAIHILPEQDGKYVVWLSGSGGCGDADSIELAMIKADEVAEMHGGWAPAPIGMGLSEWQPIGAAPKDGTTVILWGGDYNTGLFGVEPMPRPMTGSYSTRHVKDGAWHLENSISGVTTNPTHWMPLPAPPEVKG